MSLLFEERKKSKERSLSYFYHISDSESEKFSEKTNEKKFEIF